MPWKIYYWVFFLSAAAIAVIANVVARPLREFSLQAMCRAALNPRIWLAKSARAVYRFWIVNGILFPLVAVPTTVTAIGLGLVIAQGLAAILGPIEAPVMGPMAIRVAYSITFFVMLDFGHYVAHIASHKIPLLWEFHKVHHSAEVLTPITSSRFHPIDLYILNTGRGVGAAIATGIFYYLGAGEVTLSMVFGAHVAVTAYQVIGNLRHSHVWVSYGRSIIFWLARRCIRSITQARPTYRPQLRLGVLDLGSAVRHPVCAARARAFPHEVRRWQRWHLAWGVDDVQPPDGRRGRTLGVEKNAVRTGT